MTNHRNLASKIIRFEDGELDLEETIELFQHLIDTGIAWSLQGSYGRTAMALVQAGHCSLPASKEPSHANA